VTGSTPFSPPEITGADIDWVRRVLGLPADAFSEGTPRAEVLGLTQSVDVAACPGSGKTTVVVAKLAMLAQKWTFATQGLCALSHTNVAREEIETRLAHTTAGRRLLSYPHYIGTIHGFVNEFLAVPWLRSFGRPIKMIDAGVCASRRWRKLPMGTRQYLDRQGMSALDIRIVDVNFNFEKIQGTLPFGTSTATYEKVQTACTQVAAEGYYCYDDMFIWALELIEKIPEVVTRVRDRFPIVFIDETQDNSEQQSAILYKLFEPTSVIRHRLGDGNQAIFDFPGARESTTDRFPNSNLEETLPDSYRFGQSIATLADPLGIVPCGLRGLGPNKPFASGVATGPHTIFLFDDTAVASVLDAYGELLVQTFSQQELQEGTFAAVGFIHNPPVSHHADKFPQYVGDYWPDYDPELVGRDPQPHTLAQYIFEAQRRLELSNELFPALEKLADGVLRLARLVDGPNTIPQRQRQHRQLFTLLERDTQLTGDYFDLISDFIERRQQLTREQWQRRILPLARHIAEGIAGAAVSAALDFLQWDESASASQQLQAGPKRRDNIYRYGTDPNTANIGVGSIHSVKGETHTATLVLETYWYGHNLAALIRWLRGDKQGGEGVGVRDSLRLRVHYVAMTRPSHLLCLAMKRSTFLNARGRLDDETIKKLQQRGWIVRELVPNSPKRRKPQFHDSADVHL
jgi:superfamily I DNA/RNA helicase